MKRILIVIFALLIVGTLTGCDNIGADLFGQSGRGTAGKNPYDYTASGKYMAGDTLIMTVGDSPVYWDEYYYWMTVAVMNIENSEGGISDWDSTCRMASEMYGRALSCDEFVRYYAYDAALMYRAIDKYFEAEGLALDESDIYSAEDFAGDNGLEGQAELEAALESAYITREVFEYIETASAKYYTLLEHHYGVQGADYPDGEEAAFDQLDNLVSDWQEELTVSYEDAFERIIPSDIFVS